MTLTKSWNNKFLAVFSNIAKRNIALFIITALIDFLAMTFISYNYSWGMAGDNCNLIAIIVLILTSIMAFISTIISNKEVFKRKEADLFYSLPIKKETYFCASFLNSVLSSAFIHVFSLLSLMGITKLFETIAENSTSNWTYELNMDTNLIALMLLISFVVSVFYISIMNFCFSLSGKIIHFIFYVLIMFLSSAVINIGVSVILNNVYGLAFNGFRFSYICPIKTIDLINQGVSFLDVGVILVLSLVIFVCGLIVFKRRDASVCENVTKEKLALMFIMILATITIPFISFSFLGEKNQYINYIVAAVFCIIVPILVSLFLYKKIDKKKTVITIVLSLVLTVGFSLLTIFVPKISFENYVPAVEDVESIEFSSYGMFYDSLRSILGTSNSYDKKGNTAIVKEDEAKKKIINLHKKAVSEKIKNIEAGFYYQKYTFEVKYNLKNGKKKVRRYSVPLRAVGYEGTEFERIIEEQGEFPVLDEYCGVVKDDEILKQNSIFRFNEEDVLAMFVEVTSYNDEMIYDDLTGMGYSTDEISSNKYLIKDKNEIAKYESILFEDIKNRDDITTLDSNGYKIEIDVKGYVKVYAFNEKASQEKYKKEKDKILSLSDEDLEYFINHGDADRSDILDKESVVFYESESMANILK